MKRLRDDDRASVWCRGVDRSLFHPNRRDIVWRREQGIEDHEIALLFFGRLVREKGVAIFAETVATLKRRGVPVRPLLVGAGPALSAFDGLTGVVATGHLQDRDLAAVTVPRALIADAIDIIVFISGRGFARRISSIVRLAGVDPDGGYGLVDLLPPTQTQGD